MDVNTQGEPRFEVQEGWPTLLHAQQTCLPDILYFLCNGVKGELLGGHAAPAISIYLACHCPACHSRIAQVAAGNSTNSRADTVASNRRKQPTAGCNSSGRGKATTGAHSRPPPEPPQPGPIFNLEDWYVHCHSRDPTWKPPAELNKAGSADKLVKRSVMVLLPASSEGEVEQGEPLGTWMAAFSRRYHGRGSYNLVNQWVQVLWWNDFVGDDAYNPNNPFLYGNWYGGRILSVSSKSGNLKVRFTDGEEHEVALGVNFVHFGKEHPTGDQPARLPPPLPVDPAPSGAAAQVSGAGGASGSAGPRRGRRRPNPGGGASGKGGKRASAAGGGGTDGPKRWSEAGSLRSSGNDGEDCSVPGSAAASPCTRAMGSVSPADVLNSAGAAPALGGAEGRKELSRRIAAVDAGSALGGEGGRESVSRGGPSRSTTPSMLEESATAGGGSGFDHRAPKRPKLAAAEGGGHGLAGSPNGGVGARTERDTEGRRVLPLGDAAAGPRSLEAEAVKVALVRPAGQAGQTPHLDAAGVVGSVSPDPHSFSPPPVHTRSPVATAAASQREAARNNTTACTTAVLSSGAAPLASSEEGLRASPAREGCPAKNGSEYPLASEASPAAGAPPAPSTSPPSADAQSPTSDPDSAPPSTMPPVACSAAPLSSSTAAAAARKQNIELQQNQHVQPHQAVSTDRKDGVDAQLSAGPAFKRRRIEGLHGDPGGSRAGGNMLGALGKPPHPKPPQSQQRLKLPVGVTARRGKYATAKVTAHASDLARLAAAAAVTKPAVATSTSSPDPCGNTRAPAAVEPSPAVVEAHCTSGAPADNHSLDHLGHSKGLGSPTGVSEPVCGEEPVPNQAMVALSVAATAGTACGTLPSACDDGSSVQVAGMGLDGGPRGADGSSCMGGGARSGIAAQSQAAATASNAEAGAEHAQAAEGTLYIPGGPAAIDVIASVLLDAKAAGLPHGTATQLPAGGMCSRPEAGAYAACAGPGLLEQHEIPAARTELDEIGAAEYRAATSTYRGGHDDALEHHTGVGSPSAAAGEAAGGRRVSSFVAEAPRSSDKMGSLTVVVDNAGTAPEPRVVAGLLSDEQAVPEGAGTMIATGGHDIVLQQKHDQEPEPGSAHERNQELQQKQSGPGSAYESDEVPPPWQQPEPGSAQERDQGPQQQSGTEPSSPQMCDQKSPPQQAEPGPVHERDQEPQQQFGTEPSSSQMRDQKPQLLPGPGSAQEGDQEPPQQEQAEPGSAQEGDQEPPQQEQAGPGPAQERDQEPPQQQQFEPGSAQERDQELPRQQLAEPDSAHDSKPEPPQQQQAETGPVQERDQEPPSQQQSEPGPAHEFLLEPPLQQQQQPELGPMQQRHQKRRSQQQCGPGSAQEFDQEPSLHEQRPEPGSAHERDLEPLQQPESDSAQERDQEPPQQQQQSGLCSAQERDQPSQQPERDPAQERDQGNQQQSKTEPGSVQERGQEPLQQRQQQSGLCSAQERDQEPLPSKQPERDPAHERNQEPPQQSETEPASTHEFDQEPSRQQQSEAGSAQERDEEPPQKQQFEPGSAQEGDQEPQQRQQQLEFGSAHEHDQESPPSHQPEPSLVQEGDQELQQNQSGPRSEGKSDEESPPLQQPDPGSAHEYDQEVPPQQPEPGSAHSERPGLRHHREPLPVQPEGITGLAPTAAEALLMRRSESAPDTCSVAAVGEVEQVSQAPNTPSLDVLQPTLSAVTVPVAAEPRAQQQESDQEPCMVVAAAPVALTEAQTVQAPDAPDALQPAVNTAIEPDAQVPHELSSSRNMNPLGQLSQRPAPSPSEQCLSNSLPAPQSPRSQSSPTREQAPPEPVSQPQLNPEAAQDLLGDLQAEQEVEAMLMEVMHTDMALQSRQLDSLQEAGPARQSVPPEVLAQENGVVAVAAGESTGPAADACAHTQVASEGSLEAPAPIPDSDTAAAASGDDRAASEAKNGQSGQAAGGLGEVVADVRTGGALGLHADIGGEQGLADRTSPRSCGAALKEAEAPVAGAPPPVEDAEVALVAVEQPEAAGNGANAAVQHPDSVTVATTGDEVEGLRATLTPLGNGGAQDRSRAEHPPSAAEGSSNDGVGGADNVSYMVGTGAWGHDAAADDTVAAAAVHTGSCHSGSRSAGGEGIAVAQLPHPGQCAGGASAPGGLAGGGIAVGTGTTAVTGDAAGIHGMGVADCGAGDHGVGPCPGPRPGRALGPGPSGSSHREAIRNPSATPHNTTPGSTQAADVAPPAWLPPMIAHEWLAWWFVANSVGYGQQAAQALALARTLPDSLKANFGATIEACCRQLSCLPLHLRVLQVHYIQHAYVALHKVPPEEGAKLAHQLLLLIRLFVQEADLETRRLAAEASAAAVSVSSSGGAVSQGPSGGGVSGGGATGAAAGAAVVTLASAMNHPTQSDPPPPPLQRQDHSHHHHHHHQQQQQQQLQQQQQQQQQQQLPCPRALVAHHMLQTLRTQPTRGLTVEEFWQVMATCGSHCVQLIIILTQTQRSGQPVPPDVLARLPAFAELLRWAASALPSSPAAAAMAALAGEQPSIRSLSLLPRFEVTLTRLVEKLKAGRAAIGGAPAAAVAADAKRRVEGSVGAAALTGDVRVGPSDGQGGPSDSRERQCDSRGGAPKWRIGSRQLYALLMRAGSRREPSLCLGSGSDSESDSESPGSMMAASEPRVAASGPARGCSEGVGELQQHRQQQHQSAQGELAKIPALEADGSKAGGVDDPTAPGARSTDGAGMAQQGTADPGQARASAAPALAPAAASPALQQHQQGTEPMDARRPHDAWAGADPLGARSPGDGRDVDSGPASPPPPACIASAAAAAADGAAAASAPCGGALGRSPVFSEDVLSRALRAMLKKRDLFDPGSAAAGAASKPAAAQPQKLPGAAPRQPDLRAEPIAAAAPEGTAPESPSAQADVAEPDADPVALPDPAAVHRMDASWLATSVRALLTRHILEGRPAATVGAAGAASALDLPAVRTAGVTPDDLTGPPGAHSSPPGSEAGPSGARSADSQADSGSALQQAEQGPQQQDVQQRRERLEAVLAVWEALPAPRQRGLYLVSCRLARGPGAVSDWWAVEMAVRSLEVVAAAASERGAASDGGGDGDTSAVP